MDSTHLTPCSFCGNPEFKPVTTQYIYQRHGQLMVVDDVPALACTNCGETYFDIATLRRLEARFLDIYEHGSAPTEQRAVPFERWEALRNAG